MSDKEFEVPEDIEPSIFIDESLLPKSLPVTPTKSQIAYSINNNTFYNEEDANPVEEYRQFELYAEKLTNLADRKLFTADELEDLDSELVYCSSPELLDDGDKNYTQELNLIIERLHHGVVINSNVYLTNEQWNTIITMDSVLVKCFVCDMCTDVEYSNIHIKGEVHIDQLSKYKPLAKFDLSITRKIRDKYHCGVCNEAFAIKEADTHYSSKTHESFLLSAINKVSDIDIVKDKLGNRDNGNRFDNNNIGNTNNDCYHFNAAALNRDSCTSDDESEYDSISNDSDGNNEDNDVFFWDTLKTNAKQGNSYANMLKKPKAIELPLYLERSLGDKKVKVKFDAWHMLISPKANRFYCMLCKEYSHIRTKPEHCANSEHLRKLDKCKLVTSFGDYLIREMDSKFYHCGHCNNLLLVHNVKDHIDINHSRFKKNSKNSTNNDCDKENKAGNNINGNGANDKNENNINVLDKNVNNFNDSENASFVTKWSQNKIVLIPFGYRMSVSILSFNVMCKRQIDYYCGICNVVCADEMVIQHVYSISHIQILQGTPFIVPFGCHLIRAIREALHCAICNLPIAASLIYLHIRDPLHMQLLSQALSPPLKTKNISPSPPLPQNSAVPAVGGTKPKTKAKETKLTITKTKLTENMKPTDKIETTETLIDNIKEDAELSNEIDLSTSIESEIDLNEYVYLKYDKLYFKIDLISYNSVVYLGDNNRYCFVCSHKFDDEQLKKHVDSRLHTENLNSCKFLDKPRCLLRQIFLMYHCATCNVLVSRKELNNHLVWPTHIEEITQTLNASKKMRKNDIKSGIKIISAETHREIIYINEKEPEIKLLFKVKITEKNNKVLEKKMKIVIVNGDVLKIQFDSWNSVVKVKDGLKCQMCQIEFGGDELANHVLGDSHVGCINSGVFSNEYVSDLMRQINDSTLHCLVCNTEVSNKDFIVAEHTDGKKHKKNLENIRIISSTTNAYTDCDADILQL